MNRKDAVSIVKKLIQIHPDAKCSLNFSSPFEMLVAVCLSAQCTDERVNQTTPALFAEFDTPEDFANAHLSDLERLIRPCGFYKNKSKNLISAGKMIVSKFNGQVPQTMDELVSIPGVGRKSANVIMLEAFNSPQGIAVDTHCKRIARRLGFSSETEPSKIEKDLCEYIPQKYWKDVNHVFIWHGRKICSAQRPKCGCCELQEYCNYFHHTSSPNQS